MNKVYRETGSSIRRLAGAVVAFAGASLLGISAVLGTARQQSHPDSWLLYDITYADNFTIYRMNPDDRSTEIVSTGNYSFYPVGSSNGARVAFWKWHHRRWHLYQMRIDGDQTRMVLANQRNLLRPTWSEDGRSVQILPMLGREMRDTYMQTESNPVPSPDGEWLAFISRRSPNGVYIMRQDRSELQLVAADNTIADNSLTWSPDSQWIAYISRQGGETAIYRTHVDGGQVERLTQTDMRYRRLNWMPSATLPFQLGLHLVLGITMLACGLMLLRKSA